MQLVIRDGKVFATHEDGQDIVNLYPGCEIIQGNITAPFRHLSDTEQIQELDPRSAEEKLNSYKDKRRLAYPKIQDQLDMLYWDAINHTTTWADAVRAIKDQFPKP